MLERKGIEHEVVELLPGMHPVQVRLAGFRGGTVPALRIDGRRIQGSREISHALDEIEPEPALFPSDPARRRAVEAAEAWGERSLQPVPRRIFRWSLARNSRLRSGVAHSLGLPAPDVMAKTQAPIARYFARKSGATDELVRSNLEALPGMLDHVDGLIADGTIGDDEVNAADLQIGTSVRVLLSFEDVRPMVEGRPAEELAMRVLPEYPGRLPAVMPPEWLRT
jgi:glutathione S-transferase